MVLVISTMVIYFAIGVVVLRHHWRHPKEPERNKLKEEATRMKYPESDLLISHKMAAAIATVLAFLIVLPLWPMTLIPRKRQTRNPKEISR
jgi:hypothetical protein